MRIVRTDKPYEVSVRDHVYPTNLGQALLAAASQPTTAHDLINGVRETPDWWSTDPKVFAETTAKLVRQGFLRVIEDPAPTPEPEPPKRLSKRERRRLGR